MADNKNGNPKAQPAPVQGKLTPEQLAKLKPVNVAPTFVSGFQIQGTGTEFTIFCQQTRALTNEAGEFQAIARREVVAVITMSPQALKDLHLLLTGQVERFEKEYGKLDTEYSRSLQKKP